MGDPNEFYPTLIRMNLDSSVEVDEELQDIEIENVVRKRKFTQKAGLFQENT